VQLAKDLAKAIEKTRAAKERAGLKGEVTVTDDQPALRQALSAWLGSKKKRDYAVVQAYLDPSPENTAKLQAICASIRDRFGVATTLGFGPRFLHSTGQLH
jgi:transaldolase/glucose-6-phosphate isomerase